MNTKRLLIILIMLISAVFMIAWTTETGDFLFRGRVQFDGPVAITDDITQTGDQTVTGGVTASGTVSAEQLTTTDDATVTDDLAVGGDISVTGTTTFGAESLVAYGFGTATGTGVVATEYGAGPIHRTTLTLTDLTVSLTDVAGQVAYLGQEIYDFPDGAIMFLGAMADLTVTLSAAGVDADWAGDFGLGSATAAGDDTLTSTEDDILPTTATAAATASVGTFQGQSTVSEVVIYDGTTTAEDMFLNVLVDDADQDVTSTPTDMIFNGTISFSWIDIGTY